MSSGLDKVIVLCVVSTLCASCTDIKDPEYFDEGVDSDVGGDGAGDSDTGPEPATGDPCAPDGGVWSCDPLDAASCPGESTACDHGVSGGVAGFYCFGDCTEGLGAECMAEESGGPWCAAGLTCRDGTCVKYCCSSADCDGEGCDPLVLENVTGGALGTCPPEVDTGGDTDTGSDTDTGTDTDT